MKYNFTIGILCVTMFARLHAQVVTENVNFDFYQSASVNDFENNFSNGNGMNQIQTNGITGGCLTVADSVSWGNDNAIYCSSYNAFGGDTVVTSISFKYNSSTVVSGSFQRAVSIFLNPSADFNHYIIATVSGNKEIELITYGWVNTPYPILNLQTGHWYNYKLSTVFYPGSAQVYIKAEVFDLGLNGTAAPALVNSSSGIINDNVLVNDTAIQVSIIGATYGGCEYLDNFTFHGLKGPSNCVPVAVNNINTAEPIKVICNNSNNTITIYNQALQNAEVNIFTSSGQCVMRQKLHEAQSVFSTNNFADGIYIVNCTTATGSSTYYKIAVCK